MGLNLLTSRTLLAKDLPQAVEHITWVVPAGVTKVRVRSTRGNDQVVDTTLNVVEGQKFQLDVVPNQGD